MTETTGNDIHGLPFGSGRLGRILARPRTVAWLSVVLLASLGWAYLAALAGRSNQSADATGSLLAQALCQALPISELDPWTCALVFSMWVAMTVAMMLPSAAPMILTYAEIAETAMRKGERIISPLVLATGYTVVWLGFAAIAAVAQTAITQTAMKDPGAVTASGLLSGATFIGAGWYQFSALKHACLTRCQHPFPFFFVNWASTAAGVFRLGIRQGLYCLGCCWAMMLVMFAVGSMNIAWMALLATVMAIEKIVLGRRLTTAIGTALILGGIAVVGGSFIAHWPRV